MHSAILQEGHTAWYVSHCQRLKFLIDAAEYYNAFQQAALQAKQSILILGWDLDSRLLLNRESKLDEQDRQRLRTPRPLSGPPITLLDFLNELLNRNPKLKIHVLNWDYSVIYALERETMAQIKLFWSARPNLDFRFDDRHPVGASHHQKVVVIDDSIAFAGGIDLTGKRWDSPVHHPNNPGRRGPDGKEYGPFHDIQCMVSGQAARTLGELARERWRRATGEVIRPSTNECMWPASIDGCEDLHCGIVRTEPAFDEYPEVRETEKVLKRIIETSEHYLYIENQYLTSTLVGQALCESLQKPGGPEIVIVTPRECPGWLEEATMGVLRHRIVRSMQESDLYGRLYIYYPVHGDRDIFVHAKAMISDHRIAYVGSANLSNRSMGMDTECGIALEAMEDSEELPGRNVESDETVSAKTSERSDRGQNETNTNRPQISESAITRERTDRAERAERTRQEIRRLLASLLAEHLGRTCREIECEIQDPGQFALVELISRYRGGKKNLIPLETSADPLLDAMIPAQTVDPERPATIERTLSDILPI